MIDSMTESTTIKLQALLAHAGIASRRKSEELIQLGKVKVNGKIATIGQRVNPQLDKIEFENKLINAQPKKPLYYLVNKPVGYVSTTEDELGRRNVLDLIPPQKNRLYPVGRLDLDSEGLMLITNDGNLAYRLTHPKFEVKKTYHVLVEGKPTYKAIDHLRRGVKLTEGYTQPAEVNKLGEENGNIWLEIIIHEGRYHQVKRMLERVGYKTLRLIRVAMGPFDLEMLDQKRFLRISADEIATFFSTP